MNLHLAGQPGCPGGSGNPREAPGASPGHPPSSAQAVCPSPARLQSRQGPSCSDLFSWLGLSGLGWARPGVLPRQRWPRGQRRRPLPSPPFLGREVFLLPAHLVELPPVCHSPAERHPQTELVQALYPRWVVVMGLAIWLVILAVYSTALSREGRPPLFLVLVITLNQGQGGHGGLDSSVCQAEGEGATDLSPWRGWGVGRLTTRKTSQDTHFLVITSRPC